VSLKDLLKSKATPESWTLGQGAPGDPKAMEAGEAPVVRSGTFVVYETTDVDTRAILRLGAIVVAVTLAAVASTYGVFRVLVRYEARNDPPRPPLAHPGTDRRPPAPQLQTTPAHEYEQQRDRERRLLHGYGVDGERRTVHIPIEVAIQKYLAGGAKPAAASPSPVPSVPASPGAAR
jgi:hypothetical protein